MQETFDNLYERSLHNATKGLNLYKLITSRNNIRLAYRIIKQNKGSKTSGIDGQTVEDFKQHSEDYIVNLVRKTLKDYKPQSVKRVYIPKANGDKRPLGIPTILDRLIQQTIKQVLEPIAEAKFYNHSYGFRPNRCTHDALARSKTLVDRVGLHYVIDIDIKGFFDNVNHQKLLKRLYTVGITDKRVITIISKILKSPIQGVGIPTKGTPQGGILSPLLSNIFLDELDQWIYSQWEGFKTSKTQYKNRGHKHRALKKSKLKEMYIVRYADDFKIFTRDYKSAIKIYNAVKLYLKNHLGLDISTEKSKVTNIRKNSSDFLGFKLKAKTKKNKYVAVTSIADKNKQEIKRKLKELIKKIQKNPTIENVNAYNLYVISIKNYYKYLTDVYIDLAEINYQITRTLYNRLKTTGKYEIPIKPSKTYKEYNKGKQKTFKISGQYLHSVYDIRRQNRMNFSQTICNYTKEGRQRFNKLKADVQKEMVMILNTTSKDERLEYTDNRLSRYSMQKGKCSVLSTFLYANQVRCHHILPLSMGGTDEFKNLVIIDERVHQLIHSTVEQTIKRIINELNLDSKQIDKVNKYRNQCNLDAIKLV